MPRNVVFTILGLSLMTCFSFGFAELAEARSKNVLYNWNESHWETLDFKPYVENYAHTHRPVARGQVYNYDQQERSPREIVADFRAAQLLNRYYVDEDTMQSVAEVGPYFYDLSANDKRNFIATLDRVYNVTSSDLGVMFLQDWNTRKNIGQYTSAGLILF
jgi:hypothetical protein